MDTADNFGFYTELGGAMDSDRECFIDIHADIVRGVTVGNILVALGRIEQEGDDSALAFLNDVVRKINDVYNHKQYFEHRQVLLLGR